MKKKNKTIKNDFAFKLERFKKGIYYIISHSGMGFSASMIRGEDGISVRDYKTYKTKREAKGIIKAIAKEMGLWR